MTRILALDVSTTAAGWCLADDDVYVASGVFKPHGGIWQRLHELAGLAHTSFYEPDSPQIEIVAFEEPRGNHGNMDTNIKLGYANGVMLAPWLAHGLEVLPVQIATIKATGCNKTRQGRMVAASIAGKAEVSGDEADAIGCWLAAWAVIRERELEAL